MAGHATLLLSVGVQWYTTDMAEGHATFSQALWLPGTLPGLNELLDERVRGFRRDERLVNGYSSLKRSVESKIAIIASTAHLRPVESADFVYSFYEKNRLRDKSNVASGAIKLIEDALVKCGVLKGDGWACVRSISLDFLVEPGRTGISLMMRDCEPWENAENERRERSKARVLQRVRKGAARRAR